MNLENLDKAIAIMKRAGKVDMNYWQSGDEVQYTEEQKHICGTAACFAGWVAISPEWKADGGYIFRGGNPKFKNLTGSQALGEWLGIPEILSESFVNGDGYDTTGHDISCTAIFSIFYNKMWDDVNGDDVINKLIFLKENGVKVLLEQHLGVLINITTDVTHKLSTYETTCVNAIITDYREVLHTFI